MESSVHGAFIGKLTMWWRLACRTVTTKSEPDAIAAMTSAGPTGSSEAEMALQRCLGGWRGVRQEGWAFVSFDQSLDRSCPGKQVWPWAKWLSLANCWFQRELTTEGHLMVAFLAARGLSSSALKEEMHGHHRAYSRSLTGIRWGVWRRHRGKSTDTKVLAANFHQTQNRWQVGKES